MQQANKTISGKAQCGTETTGVKNRGVEGSQNEKYANDSERQLYKTRLFDFSQIIYVYTWRKRDMSKASEIVLNIVVSRPSKTIASTRT